MLKNYNFFAQDIVYLKADVNYTEFYLKDGKKIVSSLTLKYHESDERLKGFLRVSKSYLVNQLYIGQYKSHNKDVRIYLTNGYEIKVARRRRVAVKKSLKSLPRVNPGDCDLKESLVS
ncbi:LytTR family DNA-binding domain-containing protein [Emticicia sp. BO119]|uniref:LytR/AlgR family response regulator transcription factor n=1 Tax=Emticicia sp. BO119 TaxID=2757768 RepID=UPI0015F0F474|nr:LytTR family DNA-binding domain-containing protein [Emticicia sp. BO119]MBA4849660.1 LytTR family transcriptional regulator DNA-binding domain-containing protein [Emticicia sp. BO119]